MELCSMLCGRFDGRRVWRRMVTCICTAESLCCPPETILTLFIGYMKVKVTQSDFLQPHGLCSSGNSPGQNTGVVSRSLFQGIEPRVSIPSPGIKPRSPALQVDSLPAELPGKPKNTGVGSLFLLQQIFPTQELNWVSCIAGGFFTS